ncbi:MAG: response regulator transcription factor [Erysipelotrichaceae bacterium]|nr:response regulator transcription factor [Erysipelotrichaceae bacterium]MDY5252552.1 response regulator transcription factor [Erysipelotrichaceae bacterium]
MAKLIYVVDDDKLMNDLICFTLKNNGFLAHGIYSYSSATEYIIDKPDLWILDIMLEDNKSGFDLFKEIRKFNNTVPICFLSARDTELDKVTGLEIGSDDYITKPFSKKELVLRINNILKHYKGANSEAPINALSKLDLSIVDKTLYHKDDKINLTTKEFELLYYLSNNVNRVIDRNTLLRIIWDSNYFGSGRVLDDTIRRIRKKVPGIQIETVYGEGYKLVINE